MNLYFLLFGGKRVCNSLDGNSYKARTAIANLQYNTEGHSGSTFHEVTYGDLKESCLKLEKTRERKVLVNAIAKEIKFKKPRLENESKKEKNKPKPTHYGHGREDCDLEGSAWEAKKQRHFEKLKRNQDNWSNLVEETKAQRNSFQWQTVRRDLLTSSYFSRILRANNRKSYSKLIEEIIHNNTAYSNSAELRHQRTYQLEAIKIFVDLYRFEPISLCGIFIDPEYAFLGASPFRLYGNNGIIVPKCPKKAYNMSIAEALNKKLLPIWQGPLHDRHIDKKSHWYYEIQGQLHVARKRFAYLIMYLGNSAYEILEIERDNKFWKESMEDELLFFYNEGLLKELVDPRYNRGMEFRKYDGARETFL